MLKGKLGKIIIYVMSILALLYMIINLVHAASFSVLIADDFSHGVGVGKYNVPFWEYVVASFEYAKKEYMNWQGTYFSMFIQALLSPINNFGFRQLRYIMAGNALLYFGALILFVMVFLRGINKKFNYLKIIIILIIVFSFCGYEAYPEIFFWFSGATSYSIPLSILLLAAALFLMMDREEKTIYAVGSGMLGFLAMGGSLAVSGTGAFFAVLVCIYVYMTKRKIKVHYLVVTMMWIIGAGLNAIAPGNYARHVIIDQTGIHPLDAVINAFIMVIIRCFFFLCNTNFMFILLVLLLIGFYIAMNKGIKYEDNEYKARILTAIIGLFTPVVTSFPIALGYSSRALPNRCAFLIDFSIVISAVNIALLAGVVIAKHVSGEQRNIVITSMLLTIVLVLVLDGYGFRNIKIKAIADQLNDGIYENHYYACKEFVIGLEDYDRGEDVRININEFPEEIDNAYNFTLSTDPEHWINQSVADFYGFNSIALYAE